MTRRLELSLGDAAYQKGVGDPEIRNQIANLNVEIAEPKTSKKSIYGKIERRNSAIACLARDVEKSSNVQTISNERQKLSDTRHASIINNQKLITHRESLKPKNKLEKSRTVAGFALSALLLLSLSSLILLLTLPTRTSMILAADDHMQTNDDIKVESPNLESRAIVSVSKNSQATPQLPDQSTTTEPKTKANIDATNIPQTFIDIKDRILEHTKYKMGDSAGHFDYYFRQYINFGSSEVADKYNNGDNFDKIEIKKHAKIHHDILSKQKFHLKEIVFSCEAKEESELLYVVLQFKLPLRVRANERMYSGGSRFFSGILKSVCVFDTGDNFAFLTKDGTLRPCGFDDAAFVRNSDGIVYVSESDNTTIKLILTGDTDTLKTITRKMNDFHVEIAFDSIRISMPDTWGWFKEKSLSTSILIGSDTEALAYRNFIGMDVSKQPNYFVTALRYDVDTKVPDVVSSRLLSLRIVSKNQDNKVIGGYKVGDWK